MYQTTFGPDLIAPDVKSGDCSVYDIAKMKKLYNIFFVLICMVSPAGAARGESIRVYAAAQREIYLSEPFEYQIIIEGYYQEGKVDLSPLDQWAPVYRGGSQSRSIINGRQSSKFKMSYQLTARNEGRVVLPVVSVEIEGRNYKTNSVTIDVIKPGQTDRLGLEMKLSASDCYVNQPITMTINWYIVGNTNDVKDYNFDIPILQDDENFIIEDVDIPATQKNGTYKGHQATMVTFGKVLIPKRARTIEVAKPSVTCKLAVRSRQRQRQRDIWNDFFDSDPFGRGRQYKRFTTFAEGAVLNVKPLPDKGRPSDFNGLVGRYSISASATPTKVNVGDPITLTISITGELLKRVEMPDLAAIVGFSDNFSIPTEQSLPKVTERRKVFTQTIRAGNDKLKEIPAIPLSFFDVDKGQYVSVSSDPIPLEVAPTMVVTAAQAQGWDINEQSTQIEAVHRGIRANIYDQRKLLEHTVFSPLAALTAACYIALWCGSFVIFLAAGITRYSRHDSPARRRTRRQAAACRNAVSELGRLSTDDASNAKEQIAEILRRYVGDRFDRTAQSLTARDCRQILVEQHMDSQLVEYFCKTLEYCEHSQFAGAHAESQDINPRDLIRQIRMLDKNIKNNR